MKVKNVIKWLVISALSVLAIALSFLVYFPTLVSSEEGRKFLLEQMNSRIDGKLEIDKLTVSWTGMQIIEGIRLKTLEGEEILTIQELSTEASVFSFFKECPDLGETRVVGLKTGIVKGNDGKLNIEKIFRHFREKPGAPDPDHLISKAEILPEKSDKGCLIPFSGSLRIVKSRLSWKDSENEMVEIRSLEGHLDISAQNGKVDGNLEGILQCTSDEGKIEASLHFENASEKVYFDAALDPLPVSVLVNSFALQKEVSEQLDAIFGKTIRGKLKVRLEKREGNIDMQVKSDQSDATALFALKQKVLTLREPLVVNVPVTPKLSSVTLKKVNPLLVQAVSGEKPITLTVDPKGFRIPTDPFLLNSVEIPQATIEFGKIQSKNGGVLALLLALFQTNFKQNSLMTLWFTPQYLNFMEGVLSCKRMDVLIADSIHICTWGNVDLGKEKIDMVIGITGDTLIRAFHINSVSEDYVLQTPIRGSIDNPKVDFGKTVALIASMRLAGSDKKLLGNLLNSVFTEKRSGDAPAPTTTPFPWGEDWKKHAAEGNVKDGGGESSSDNPKQTDEGDSDKKPSKPKDKDVLKKALQKEALKLFN